MDILFHICCAPCAVWCVQSLRAEGIEPVGYWYNPNIHPFTEYRARRDTLRDFAAADGFRLIEEDDYGLRGFVRAVADDIDGRCAYCYECRLDAAAAKTAELGLKAFSTSLLISPYQKHDMIIETARAAAQRHGVEFLYRDFRPGFREGQQMARDRGFYMQKYCGCIFSEEERYRKKKKPAKA